MVHLRKESLHNHRSLAQEVPNYVFVKYENLLNSDGTVNDAEILKIAAALGLGENITPASSEIVPYFTYSKPKRWWIPWRNLVGLSPVSFPKDRIRYRREEEFMCAYRQVDLDVVNAVLDEAEEMAVGYRLVRKATRLRPGVGPLKEADVNQIWPTVATRCVERT